MRDYNGWKNYEIWNVALRLGNDEGLTSLASGCRNYMEMIEQLPECGCTETPDGFAYKDSGLDRDVLDEAMMELQVD